VKSVQAYAAYVPQRRLDRTAVLQAHQWHNGALAGLAKGYRSIAAWDEDVVTMAVAAAKQCNSEALSGVERLFLGSTSFPFADRQNSAVVADALELTPEVSALDVAGSQRAGSGALMAALSTTGRVLALGSEKRPCQPGSTLEMTEGDGAAALLVADSAGLADYIGGLSRTHEFVDHHRGSDAAFDTQWEDRWLRDEGYMTLLHDAIRATLDTHQISAADVAHLCLPIDNARTAAGVARALSFSPVALRDPLQRTLGNCGAAHPLMMLCDALDHAAPGEVILVAGFGQGCDVMLFRATDALPKYRLARAKGVSLADQLAAGRPERNYTRYLTLAGHLKVDRGLRAEVDKSTSLSAHFRSHEMAQQFRGGRCSECGTVQFPKTPICVNPACRARDSQGAESFADKQGALMSFTADALTYTPHPPNYYGMVQFKGGGRLMMDLTGVEFVEDLSVGMTMKMAFRVKDYDPTRGFRRYFWKAMPLHAAQSAEET